jgi:hypothetical protein
VNKDQHVYMRGVVAVGSTCRCGADADVTFHHPDGGAWDVCQDCGIRQAQRISESIGKAVESLVEAHSIVDKVFPIEPTELKGKILSATRELATLGGIKMCAIEWCENKYPHHNEHSYRTRITNNSGSEHLDIGTAVDVHRDVLPELQDDISIRAWFAADGDYDSVVVNLTEAQAREVIAAIELAIARRAELRGLPR